MAPIELRYFPAGQGVQAAVVPPEVSEYEPVGHSVQEDVTPVPGREYEPGGHGRHWFTSVAPVVAQYVPAGQSAQTAPRDEYLPAAHTRNPDAPVLAKVPPEEYKPVAVLPDGAVGPVPLSPP